jgi:uracil-DNA glycosylase
VVTLRCAYSVGSRSTTCFLQLSWVLTIAVAPFSTSRILMTSAEDFLPDRFSLTGLARAAETCRGCELYQDATQTVFGRGRRTARLMLVGETPGDEEDREGEPFVGPAGRLLDDVLAEAAVTRGEVYVTNAVKHFRWEARGKRRLHKKPGARHIEACKPWLHAEILVVKPKVIICLGATAAQVMLGRDFRITKNRGEFVRGNRTAWLVATYHPSAILRAPDKASRNRMRHALVTDLAAAAKRARAPIRKR